MSPAVAESLLLCFKRFGWVVTGWSCPTPQASPWDGHQVWVLGFAQVRIQEQDKIKKKKVYSGRYTLHRSIDRVWAIIEGKRKERESTRLTVFIRLGNLQANEWEDYSSYFGKEVGISGSWPLPTFWTFMVSLRTVLVPVVCHLACWCITMGLPRLLGGKEYACQWSRCGFDPRVRFDPWRRKW